MQTVKIELPIEKLQVVMDALSRLPWATVNPIIVDIDRQVSSQIQPDSLSEAQ